MKRQFPLIVFILVSFAGQIHAQNIWQKLTLPENSSFFIQASPNGKLFLSMKNNLYVSTDEGSSWNIAGAAANFQIDSQGVFVQLRKQTLMLHSYDEGKTWIGDTIVGLAPHFFSITKDTVFIFLDGPEIYGTIDGKSWRKHSTFNIGLDSWAGVIESPLGKLYGGLLSCSCIININRNQEPVILDGSFTCFSDNSPPEYVSFDYSGYGYFVQLCTMFRSSDNGKTWVKIDSANSQSHRYLPPYLSLLNNDLLKVTDSITIISKDHSDTWQKIGEGIQGAMMIGYYGEMFSFVDRQGNAFIMVDSSLYILNYKDVVPPSISNSEVISLRFNQESGKIELQSSSDFGETTASLYTIDGRLLHREKINIPAPGSYEFDASGIHSQFGFLVLQTAKGVITRKIIF